MKSNCLLVALERKIFHWRDTNLCVRYVEWGQVPHFYWYSKERKRFFHFSAKNRDLPLLQTLWFEGRVERLHFTGIATPVIIP